MDQEVLSKIRAINSEFYQTFAGSFADTRQRLQPGVLRLLPAILRSSRVLELGCGHGAIAGKLLEQGFEGRYLGLDLSPRMLELAQAATQDAGNFEFLQIELGPSALGWHFAKHKSPEFQPPYDHIAIFATLHHIPGNSQRAELAQQLSPLLDEGGAITLSVWNFLDSARLQARLVPWDVVGLNAKVVEPGDYLIDWRRDGRGLRYVHHFSESELSSLARKVGFDVSETFYSDGETGRLGLYQTWR
jgi:SAM-dependent methyltransferase